MSSRIRLFVFGAAVEDTRFLFDFSKALVGAAHSWGRRPTEERRGPKRGTPGSAELR